MHDITPETEEFLRDNKTSGYIGFDPTATSLHIGSMVQIILLQHMQRAGHRPIALVGGATGMVGDPSGKSAERNLLDENALQANIDGIKAQLEKFLDFDSGDNPAILLNNFDWIGKFSFIDFLRDVGKHLTVNYMMAKESVKKRVESQTGISFTEFSYQLLQGYDFYHLYKNHDCKFQCGGSDQWGNIVTGTELIRRMDGGKAYAFTVPLVTKADGSKFGKSEEGNVWLDPELTSPYKFYQFWINVADEDAERFIKIFTFFDKEKIDQIIAEHREAPHMRFLQKTLAEDITKRVHSEEDLERAIVASSILFGKSTKDELQKLDERSILEIFEGVPHYEVAKDKLAAGMDMISLLAGDTEILKSNGEARRALKENSISVNKEKVQESTSVNASDLLNDKYLIVQRGKKNYFLVSAV